MGHTHGAVFVLLTTVFAFLAVQLMAGDQELGARARIRSFTMPQYHDGNNRLQFIVYGKNADNKGAVLLLDDMVIDFIRNNLDDVNEVKMLPDVEAYPLNVDPKLQREFWKPKGHSQGLVFADTAVLDKNIQVLRSDKPVKFRSPMLDVDGVGFDAYQNRKFLHIRSKVVVKIRPLARKNAGIGFGSASSEKRTADEYYQEEIKQQSNMKKKD